MAHKLKLFFLCIILIIIKLRLLSVFIFMCMYLCKCVCMAMNSSRKSSECCITKLGMGTQWVTGMLVGYLTWHGYSVGHWYASRLFFYLVNKIKIGTELVKKATQNQARVIIELIPK